MCAFVDFVSNEFLFHLWMQSAVYAVVNLLIGHGWLVSVMLLLKLLVYRSSASILNKSLLCKHTHTDRCEQTPSSTYHECTHTDTCIHIHPKHIHTCTHTYTHSHTHMYKHIHTYIHTQCTHTHIGHWTSCKELYIVKSTDYIYLYTYIFTTAILTSSRTHYVTVLQYYRHLNWNRLWLKETRVPSP